MVESGGAEELVRLVGAFFDEPGGDSRCTWLDRETGECYDDARLKRTLVVTLDNARLHFVFSLICERIVVFARTEAGRNARFELAPRTTPWALRRRVSNTLLILNNDAAADLVGLTGLPLQVQLKLLEFGDARTTCRAAATCRSLDALCGGAALWAALLRRDFPGSAADEDAKYDYAAKFRAAREAARLLRERRWAAHPLRSALGLSGRARVDVPWQHRAHGNVLWQHRMRQHESMLFGARPRARPEFPEWFQLDPDD
ncbi:hypothetical protein M885DRAFT_512538 [Pelagophyceae sp. CCMP2097]|nr:hypothetical protein M885DRAFT_512538 [Pelagophyceae sp. CCMP2097]|mmetsp:Transcript_20462/g.69356  ORF Transcript_20462/g.69356 Transcript_20462/m.69356 type:complete len:258 (-) Transcript_20462:94-867(-)